MKSDMLGLGFYTSVVLISLRLLGFYFQRDGIFTPLRCAISGVPSLGALILRCLAAMILRTADFGAMFWFCDFCSLISRRFFLKF